MISKITLLFIAIFSIIQLNAETITVNNTNDSGPGSLRDAVNQASNGDVIQFNPNLISSGNATINLLSEISINRSIQVIGLFNTADTLFLSGRGVNRIFNINLSGSTDSTLVLDALFVINGKTSDKGGAFYVANTNSLAITNSLFKRNYALSDGGAIYTLGNCDLTISNSAFLSDTSMNNGGAIYMNHRSNMLVENSFFDLNYANSGGGAIFNYSVSSTSNLSNLVINNCEFRRNRRFTGEGAAIYSQKANITVNSSLFTENVGSAIAVTSLVSAAHSTAAYLHINNTDFIDNMSFGPGAALDLENYNVEISDCNFDANVSSGGGAISAKSLIVSIADSKFTNNTGGSSGGGAVRFIEGTTSIITSCSFSYNSANFGGAINGVGDIEIHSCTFDHNTSQVGGAIYGYAFSTDLYNTEILISKSTITENRSTNNGGGLYFITTGNRFVRTTIENSTIYKNSTVGTGGAMNMNATTTASSIELKSCIVAENGESTIVNTNSPTIVSQGYNIFSDASLSGQAPTDQMNVDSTALDLQVLQNYGGTTLTMRPGISSVAIDMGDPSDLTDAQNAPIVGGIRDVGAAEYVCTTFNDLTINSCGPYTSESGTILTSSGIYYDTASVSGCNTFSVIDLTISQPSSSTDVQVACENYTWINGTTYSSSNNTATYVIPNSVGCDSTITLNLTINQPTSVTDVQLACEPFTWINGTTYTSSNNTAVHVIPSSAGCDSTITLNLTIAQPSASTDVQTACGSYTWINGTVYTSSTNTATYIIPNMAGCDSTITLDLTLLNSFGTDIQTGCGPFTWIDGNVYTNSNNSATYAVPNAAGCDSIITLNLTIQTSFITDVQSACDTYTWIDGISYVTSNNSATYTLTNALGCDSIITLNLTITTLDNATTVNGSTITATQSNASYTWVDCNNGNAPISGATSQSFSPTINGNYAVIITKNGCTETSDCVTITNVGIEESPSANHLVIYPNPSTNGLFNINYTGQLNDIEVLDQLGRKVNIRFNKNNGTLDGSQLAPGKYLVRLFLNDADVVIKSIVVSR